MRFLHLLFVILFAAASTFGQSSDSSQIDDEGYDYEYADQEEEGEVETLIAPNDSLPVVERNFSQATLDELRSDSDLMYEQPPTVAESIWARFKRWLISVFDDLFEAAVNTNVGQLLVYAVGLLLVILAVMMLLKVNAFKILYGSRAARQQYDVLDENIHEMDFDKLVQEAVAEGDYRRGVRLLFLWALKLLSDRGLIQWEMGKTNHDYQRELRQQELRSGFNQLSYYFEYVWYGNFLADDALFKKANDIFLEWRKRI